MSRPVSSQEFSHRRKHHLDTQAWGAEEEEEAWASPPSPRRSRWERPGPADWGPEEPPAETEAGPGSFAPWDRKHPPQTSWRGRARNRPAGQQWDRPGYSQKSWGSPTREGGGSLERPPRTQWMPRRGRGRGRGRGGGRWSSPERTGGGRRRTPSPGQGAAWDSAEAPSRHQGPNGDTRAWGSPGREGAWERSRNVERRAREERPGSPGGAGGRWATAGRRKEESQSPSRERRSLGSSGRDIRQESRGSTSGWSQPSREQVVGSSNENEGRWGRTERRGRERHSPIRKQSGWGSPKREERQEHSGTTRRHEREQGQVNPDEAGSRRSSAWYRDRNYQNRSKDEGSLDSPKREQQSPNGEARGQGSPVRYHGAENLDGGGAEEDSRERGGEEKKTYAAGSDSPEESAFLTELISGSPAVPKEWTPRESVVHWWTHCQSNLQNKMREQLMTLCPRPTLPDKSSETPRINPDILSLLNKRQEKELRSATYVSLLLQDEVLDMLAPAMTIYEMAEEAMEKDEPVDPMELREWSRHLIRFIGSINNRLTLKHRSEVLSCINPRLKSVVSKMSGQSTEGMLFAEDKVKLLKEIILRFPQLTEIQKLPRKRYYPFARPVYDKQAPRRPLLKSRPKPLGTGKRGTADQRVEQSHSQGARGQGPAERR